MTMNRMVPLLRGFIKAAEEESYKINLHDKSWYNPRGWFVPKELSIPKSQVHGLISQVMPEVKTQVVKQFAPLAMPLAASAFALPALGSAFGGGGGSSGNPGMSRQLRQMMKMLAQMRQGQQMNPMMMGNRYQHERLPMYQR